MQSAGTNPSPFEMTVACRVAAGHAAMKGVLRARFEIDSQLRGSSEIVQTRRPVGHRGDAPRPIDVRVQHAVRSAFAAKIHELLGPDLDVAIIGEEADESVELHSGQIIVLVDPVDGTTVSRHRADGYCSALAVLVVDNDLTPQISAAAIALPTGYLVECSWAPYGAPGEVGLSTFSASAPHDEPATSSSHWVRGSLRPGDPGVIAIVAAKPHDRADVQRHTTLWESEEATVYTQAGNPIVVGLLFGELGGVMLTKPESLHDTIYLLMLEQAGGVILGLDGEPVSIRERFECFDSVPACVAATTRVGAEFLLGTVRSNQLVGSER